MKLTQALKLKVGQYVYHTEKKNADGKTAMRAKVTSVKTWKRDSSKIEVHVKRGLKEFAVFNENELQYITEIEPN